jgi:hypothetical protein
MDSKSTGNLTPAGAGTIWFSIFVTSHARDKLRPARSQQLLQEEAAMLALSSNNGVI